MSAYPLFRPRRVRYNDSYMANVARRWLPRFSLRTLLVAVMLIGSSGVLWISMGSPWRVVRTFSSYNENFPCAISSSGRFVSFWTRDAVWACEDVQTGSIRTYLSWDDLLQLNVGEIIFSPDDRLLALLGEKQVILQSIESATTTKHIKGNVIRVVFSADGSRLATINDDGVVEIWNTKTAERLSASIRYGKEMAYPSMLAFSPTGDKVAVVNARALPAIILDPANGKELLRLEAADDFRQRVEGKERNPLDDRWPNHVVHAEFSSDGLQLLSW